MLLIMKTKSSLHRLITALLLAGSLVLNSGCWLLVVGAAAGAGAVTVAYVNGDLKATYGYGYDRVVAATEKSIDQLGFTKAEEQKDAISDTFHTHNAKGDSVKIVVTRSSDSSTDVDIRIGTFGDEQLSMEINDKIKANL
jgi:hypothetical protein